MTSSPDAAETTIRHIVDTNAVALFMKGVPEAPQCGFSAQVAGILNHLAVPYHAVNVLADEAIREGVKRFADWPTVPQLYIKGEFVGGCDIVRTMFENGELRETLTRAGIPVKENA